MPKFELSVDVYDGVYRRPSELVTTFDVDEEDLEELDTEGRHQVIAAHAEEAFWRFVAYDWKEIES